MRPPALALIRAAVAERLGVSQGEMRLGFDREAVEARGAYGWLADEMTTHSVEAAALVLGVWPQRLAEATASVRAMAAADPAIAGQVEELMIEVAATAAAEERLGIVRREPREPRLVAEDLLSGGFRAFTVSREELQVLAAALIALLSEPPPAPPAAPERVVERKVERRFIGDPGREVAAVVAAWREVEQTNGTSLERGARVRLEAKLTRLSTLLPKSRKPAAVQKETA